MIGEYVAERENTMIDYVIGNYRTRERIREFRVEDKIDSDHKAVTVCIEGEKRNFEECKGGRRGRRREWSEEGRGIFREEYRDLAGIGEGKGIEEK